MSTGSTQPFRPSGTATLAAGSASTNTPLVGRGEAALVYNASAATAFIRFGTDDTVSATITDTPVPPAQRVLLHCGPVASSFAAVLASGSGPVYVSRGDGTVY